MNFNTKCYILIAAGAVSTVMQLAGWMWPTFVLGLLVLMFLGWNLGGWLADSLDRNNHLRGRHVDKRPKRR